ncbi:DoxX family protein [Mucilaginibacter arboris]|uniref:DoxX family protein n=1 Tax=Mucilaginibacter arboris TaxID=2682090 RepID=UPI00293BE7D6|nr:DoxX family protein [Mucilaginibacter arboris]
MYWIITIIFSLFMLMDGIGAITRAAAGQEVLKHLGYPMYALTIFGVAKILGVIAILQTKFYTIKEWA